MTDTLDAFRKTLEDSQRESTVQVLFKCARLANEKALHTLPAHPSGARLRQSHTALFPYVTLEGTRLTELAQKVGISKQAVGQLVDELVELSVFERVEDPSDARAKLVRWTPKGQQGLLAGLKALRELELQLAEAVGHKTWQQLRHALLRLQDHLMLNDTPQASPVAPSNARSISKKTGKPRKSRAT